MELLQGHSSSSPHHITLESKKQLYEAALSRNELLMDKLLNDVLELPFCQGRIEEALRDPCTIEKIYKQCQEDTIGQNIELLAEELLQQEREKTIEKAKQELIEP